MAYMQTSFYQHCMSATCSACKVNVTNKQCSDT